MGESCCSLFKTGRLMRVASRAKAGRLSFGRRAAGRGCRRWWLARRRLLPGHRSAEPV